MSDNLTIKVGLKASPVATGLAALRGQLGGFKTAAVDSFKSMVSPVTLVAAATAGVGFAFDAMIAKAGKLTDMSAKFGITGESLQRIGNAASLNGVELEAVGGTLNKIVLSIEKVRKGDEKAAESLDDLGISTAEFIDLEPDQAFLRIADAVKTAEDRGRAYAAVIQLAGRSSGDLFSTLEMGSAEIRRVSEEMGILSEANRATLDDVGDSLDSLKNKFLVFGAETLGNMFRFFDRLEARMDIFTAKLGRAMGTLKKKDSDALIAGAEAKLDRANETPEQRQARKKRVLDASEDLESSKPKNQVIADSLTRAGGGGIAYLAPDKEAAAKSAQSLERIEETSRRSEAALQEIKQKIGPAYWQ
jgi:hypothetical protein